MKSKTLLLLCMALLVFSLACMLFWRGGGVLKFEPDELPYATLGQAYESQIQVTENITPVGAFSISEGALPAGLEFVKLEDEDDIARIRGVPEVTGIFTFKVSVWCYGTNVSGQTGEKEYTILVEE